MFRRHILPTLAYHFYRAWISTWKISICEHPSFQEDRGKNRSLILAHWHGDELASLSMVGHYGLATMTSRSRDGQMIDSVIRKLGGKTSKGSSSRGGASALLGLIRLCREGRMASIAVDGPRGPIHRVKQGIFELSRLAGARIVPCGVAASSAIVFRKSWNQAYLPHLFAKVVIHVGEPLPALTRDEDPKDPLLAEKLRESLFRAREEAARLLRPG